MNEWEKTYSAEGRAHKNIYPNTEIVSFVIREIAPRNPDHSKIRILDLGCGWGNNLRFLEQEGFDAYGIDISETAVNNCKKIVKNPENIKVGDAEHLDYPKDFFDCILDRCSIQHNPMVVIKQILSKVLRTLKNNGIFYSIFISETDPSFLYQTTYLKKEEINDLFKGFKTIEVDYTIQTFENEKNKMKVWNIKAVK